MYREKQYAARPLAVHARRVAQGPSVDYPKTFLVNNADSVMMDTRTTVIWDTFVFDNA